MKAKKRSSVYILTATDEEGGLLKMEAYRRKENAEAKAARYRQREKAKTAAEVRAEPLEADELEALYFDVLRALALLLRPNERNYEKTAEAWRKLESLERRYRSEGGKHPLPSERKESR